MSGGNRRWTANAAHRARLLPPIRAIRRPCETALFRPPRGPILKSRNAPNRCSFAGTGTRRCRRAWQTEGNSWNKLRYSGGTVDGQGQSLRLEHHVDGHARRVDLRSSDARRFASRRPRLRRLSYGQEAHRRVADMVALSLVATPLALFGILHQSKTHFIGIEYRTRRRQTGRPSVGGRQEQLPGHPARPGSGDRKAGEERAMTMSLQQFVYLLWLAPFAFGALSFCTLAIFYWRQLREAARRGRRRIRGVHGGLRHWPSC